MGCKQPEGVDAVGEGVEIFVGVFAVPFADVDVGYR
jgi:hypothetical protein